MCKGQLGRQDYIDERNREGGLRIEPFNEHIDLKLASYDITPTMIAMSAKCGLLETVYQKKDMSLYIKVRPRDTVLVVSNEFISVPPYMAGYVVSRVSKVADGFGHVSTSIDPNWQGALLIALSNPANKPIKISVGRERGPNARGDSLATISFHDLNESSPERTSPDPNFTGMRLDLLQNKQYSARSDIKATLYGLLHFRRRKFTKAFFEYIDSIYNISPETWPEISKAFNGLALSDSQNPFAQYIVKETWRTRVLNWMKRCTMGIEITNSQMSVQSGLVETLLLQSGEHDAVEKLKPWLDYFGELSKQILGDNGQMEISKDAVKDFGELFEELYGVADRPEYYQIRTPLLKAVDEFLEMVSARVAFIWWYKHLGSCDNILKVQEKLSQIGKFLMERPMSSDADIPMFYEYMLVHNIVPALSNAIHEVIARRDSSLFTELFQKYGNSIRRYGGVSFENGADIPVEQADRIGDNAFAIPRRINQFIKSFRHPFDRSYARPTRIVIDSIKSVLESTYLRERYSAFYLFAISADDRVREQRLINGHKKKLNIRDIRIIDWNEFSNHGAEIYRDYNDEAKRKLLDEDEKEFAKIVIGEQGGGHIVDSVRKEAYESGLQQFILQDVGSAIQNADVFISNNHSSTAKNMELRWEIVRSVSLIMYPGLLLPTPIERCMQTAFAAKANSGCLSRQVGAVVTDAEYNILSVGWNDVPDCDISCARKNLLDIQKELDMPAYSKYELENKNFRRRLGQIFDQNLGDDRHRLGELLCGLPWSYCFKDIHRDDRQPMRSRAMHGEEKALTKVPEQVPGGYLFTTSSLCEMCSKNAKNHHIQKIYYIEQYPGISAEQYSESGYTCNRAQHILFTGAVGRAYIQMYTPIMPHKDALKFMGINYKLE